MRFENRLDQLREKFVLDLPDRLQEIKRLYHEGQRSEALYTALHRLTGLAGTFKAHRISELARSIELQYFSPSSDISEETQKIVATLLGHLEEAVHQYLADPNASPPYLIKPTPSSPTPKTIGLIERDTLTGKQIASVLEENGYRIDSYDSLSAFANAIQNQRALPSLLLIDHTSIQSDNTLSDTLSKLKHRFTHFPPIVLMSEAVDTPSRINALRAGAAQYLLKPIKNVELINVVARYLHTDTRNKILIVDDDAICADYIAYVIQNAGMQPKVLTDPFQAFETLADFEPDLLILDINMPGCNGIELAQAIRQCSSYNLMPIIFLTTGSDIDRDLCALSSGGDELILKTESNEHLLQKINSRLRRHREARLVNEQLYREQQRAERLRKSQSDFLTYVVHELKAPLHVMLGFSELLKMDPSLLPTQVEMVDEIIRGGKNQLSIIEDLSEQIKIATGKLSLNIEDVDVIPLLSKVIADASVLGLASNIGIDANFNQHETQIIKADSRRLSQVLNNLLSNAIKYNKPAGKVWVNIQNRSNGMLRINVMDTGIGIASDDLEYVFDAFERFSPQRQLIEGTGVGLSICRQLIELMAGRIGVSSQLHIGSQFWLELPLASR